MKNRREKKGNRYYRTAQPVWMGRNDEEGHRIGAQAVGTQGSRWGGNRECLGEREKKWGQAAIVVS